MDKDVLLKRIWFTKKARMNAESRLIKTDSILTFLLMYYSAAFTTFQLTPKFFDVNNADQLDWLVTACSLFVLVFSVVIGSSNFKLQAEKMKNSYQDLTSLEYSASFGTNMENIAKLYTDILQKSDNHFSWDYEKAMLWTKLNPAENWVSLTFRHIKHYAILLLIWILIVSAILFPIGILFKFIVPGLK